MVLEEEPSEVKELLLPPLVLLLKKDVEEEELEEDRDLASKAMRGAILAGPVVSLEME